MSNIWAKGCMLTIVCVFSDLTWLPLIGGVRKSWYIIIILLLLLLLLLIIRFETRFNDVEFLTQEIYFLFYYRSITLISGTNHSSTNTWRASSNEGSLMSTSRYSSTCCDTTEGFSGCSRRWFPSAIIHSSGDFVRFTPAIIHSSGDFVRFSHSVFALGICSRFFFYAADWSYLF